MNLFLFSISIFLLSSSVLSLSLSNLINHHHPINSNSIESSLFLPSSSSSSKVATRALTGRFLHITDLHPDPSYKYGSDIDEGVCHRKIKRLQVNTSEELDTESVVRGKGKAGYWGEPDSVCDSPITLIDSTFNWLSKHLTSPSPSTSTPSSSTNTVKPMEIDFIIWSGDNSRHDLDPELPRKLDEIYDLNRYVAKRMKEYVDNGVTVVTCFGNNDVFPHNTMYTGPSSLTKEFAEIWKDFIPQSQINQFIIGGYYSLEAIPSKLLLISLNTMFMYNANKVVKGCPSFDSSTTTKARKRKIDPGTLELIWLEKELEKAREAGMQVWLVGHVSPSLDNWYEGCYVEYGELVLRFHDTILGQLFGHMNTDHFSYYQADDVYLVEPSSSFLKRKPSLQSLSISPIKPLSMEADLRSTYSKIPRKKDRDLGDYSIINVSPSVIPTYSPSLRIWQYNVTEVEGGFKQLILEDSVIVAEVEENEEVEAVDVVEPTRSTSFFTNFSLLPYLFSTFASQKIFTNYLPTSLLTTTSTPSLSSSTTSLKKGNKKKPKPHLPRHSSPLSPSQSNTFLSPLGFTQFYLDLNSANKNSGYGPGQKGRDLLAERGEKGKRDEPEWSIEYSTFETQKFAEQLLGLGSQEVGIPKSLIPSEILEVLIDESRGTEERFEMVVGILEDLDLVPYEMEDLTIGSWLKLARELSRNKKDWKGYVKRMTLGY